MTERVFGAIDLGASSGRVAAGVVRGGVCALHVLHRFANGPTERSGRLRWDFERIFTEVLAGLRILASEFPGVESIGVDGWGIDVGLLDEDGILLEDPISYRDDRSASYVPAVHSVIDRCKLFELTGQQFLPFATIYQLASLVEEAVWNRVVHVVLFPDLVAYRLTGVLASELTNASTTGLLEAHGGSWCGPAFEALGCDPSLFPPLRSPGAPLGHIAKQVAKETGLPESALVTTVASHDTASAVVAVPTDVSPFAYISSGTWSLVGTELATPVLTPQAREANFTNERGLDGTVRFLRNTGGMWLLQECLRSWNVERNSPEFTSLLSAAGGISSRAIFDVDNPDLVGPGDMPNRIIAAVPPGDRAALTTQPAVVRSIMDSLAVAYAGTVDEALSLSCISTEVIHIVGGGSQNALLCQLTADASGRSVVAGPAEATALGNVLVQAREKGALPMQRSELRKSLAAYEHLEHYRPQVLRVRGAG
jgi:rhamnulokinase